MTPAELPPAPSCAERHGSEAHPAPPSALGGIGDPTYIGVGAHQAQLLGGTTVPTKTAPMGDPGTPQPQGCTDCHGADGDPSPPTDTQGRTDPTLITVGAHEARVDGTVFRDGVACSDCHVSSAAVGDAGHLDAALAEVPFGALAVSGGATPAWTGSTCTDTYGHAGGAKAMS